MELQINVTMVTSRLPNASTTKGVSTSGTDLLVSDFVYSLVSYVILRNIVQVLVRVTGACANVINIVVFMTSSQLDSVTVCFLALAVSDLGFLSIHLVPLALGILEKSFQTVPYLDLSSLSFVVSIYALMCVDISFLLTTYLSVQKACCVVIPFQFKNVFTRARSTVVVIIVYILVFVYYLPSFVSMAQDLKPYNSRGTNITRIFIVLSPFSRDWLRIFRAINKTALPLVTQTIVILCLVLLIVHLKRSSSFHRLSNLKHQHDASEAKGQRAIQAVAVVAAMFVASNTPDIVINIASLLVSEFNDRRLYNNLYWVVEDASNIVPLVNASVHICVYLKFNSSYSRQFRKLFSSARRHMK